MSITFGQAFGGNSGAAAGGWSAAIFTSRTFTFTEAGVVVMSLVGAGGGGASAVSGAATGGNSAPWGRKKIKVSTNDVLSITIGAGGLKSAIFGASGSQGSATTVTLNGATIMTVQGGEGGVYLEGVVTATAATPAATVTGADFWRPGIQAGSATPDAGSAGSGGAAVDVLSNGTGRSPSAVGGSGTTSSGGSIGTDLGGLTLGWIALLEWGFVITDGSMATTSRGIPGNGGTVGIAAGAFAGGHASAGHCNGGLGGGGAGSPIILEFAGNGGNAYGYLSFTPEA